MPIDKNEGTYLKRYEKDFKEDDADKYKDYTFIELPAPRMVEFKTINCKKCEETVFDIATGELTCRKKKVNDAISPSKTTSLPFFRYNGKRYTFKVPVELKIIEEPGLGDGEFFDVENEEWDLRGSDTRSLEYAIEEAEYFFQFYNGWLVTTKKKLSPKSEVFRKKILANIESVTDDDSAPWGYVDD